MSVYPWLEFKWWMIGLTVPWGKMQSLIQSIGYTIQQSVKGRLNCFHYSDAVEVHAVGTPDCRLLAPETGHRILKPNRLQTNSLTHDSMGHMFHVQFSPLLSLSLSLKYLKWIELCPESIVSLYRESIALYLGMIGETHRECSKLSHLYSDELNLIDINHRAKRKYRLRLTLTNSYNKIMIMIKNHDK